MAPAPAGSPPGRARTGLGRGALVVFIAVFVVGLVARPAAAKVFVSQNQALAEAFPEATRIERDTHILLKRQAAQVQELTKDREISKIVVLHTAWAGEELLGFAHIDVHNVRTKPEAFLVVLTPEGIVRSVRVLAFHEPLDYLPTEGWYAQFEGKSGEDRLRVGRDVHGVVGATLSARAAADGVRRMLAYYEVLLAPEHGDATLPGPEGPEGEDAGSEAVGPEAAGRAGSARLEVEALSTGPEVLPAGDGPAGRGA